VSFFKLARGYIIEAMDTRSAQRGSFAFLGLLILAGVFIFLAYWVRSPDFPLRRQLEDAKTEEERIASGVRYRIEITDKGFVPGVVRIEPYDTVTFINRDTRAHWPVAGDLEGRGVCAEFGQGRELIQNEGYAIVFREENECRFFDKLEEKFSAGTIYIEKQ
jgi:plastocyanin